MGLETLALVAGIGGGVMSAAGSIQKGQAAQEAANYNAAVAAQRAAEERDSAAAATQDYVRKGSDTLASATALRGATGVTSEGSPLMVDEATVRQVALGAARTLHGGELRANRLEDDAKLQKMKGENAVTASYLDAGSSLLTTAGKFGKGGFGTGTSA